MGPDKPDLFGQVVSRRMSLSDYGPRLSEHFLFIGTCEASLSLLFTLCASEHEPLALP